MSRKRAPVTSADVKTTVLPDDVAVRRGQVFRARGGARVVADSVDWAEVPPRVTARILPDPLQALAQALDGVANDDVFEVALTWAADAAGVKAWRMPAWYESEP